MHLFNRSESHAAGLVDSVLHGEPYRIRGLIIHGASLLTSWPETPVWRERLSKLDFVVCIYRQMTADAAYADIVQPATTTFEIDSYMVYRPIFRLRENVFPPVGQARDEYLITAELTRRHRSAPAVDDGVPESGVPSVGPTLDELLPDAESQGQGQSLDILVEADDRIQDGL